MGQAAVDLPDSPDKAPAPLNSADDLLSRLAGAEIDRMLAASEQTDTSLAGAETLEPNEATKPAQDVYAAEVDHLFKQLSTVPLEGEVSQPQATQPTVEAAAVAPAVETETSGPAIEPGVAAFQPDSSAAAVPAPEPMVTTIEATAVPSAPPPQPAAVAVPLTPAMSPAQHPAPEPITVAAAIESAVKEIESERASLLVRALELINAPLAWCPDVARDLLGKLAILTFMNAMGVLLYIVLFRK